MLTDETITLRDTACRELALIAEMEQGEAYSFVIPYSLPRHQDEFEKPAIVYKSIYRDDKIIGFVILALDPDGRSVEFRRIVVSVPGYGYGKRVVEMVRELSKTEFGRKRVWLDVFETNKRARHVYEQCGYQLWGKSEHEGRTLLLYEMMV